MWVCVCVHARVCEHACVHVCACVCVAVHMHGCACVCAPVCVCVHVYVCRDGRGRMKAAESLYFCVCHTPVVPLNMCLAESSCLLGMH